MSKNSASTLWKIFWGGHTFKAEKSVETGKTDFTHALPSLQLFHCRRSKMFSQFSSVTQSCLTLCDTIDCSMPGHPAHHQLGVYSDLCPLSQWCHPTISSSVIPFSSCLQSFPASGSFLFLFFFIFTFLYCSGFCHTLKWNSHGFTRVPHPDPPSHLPLHPIPLSLPSAPGPSACLMHPTWAGDLFHPR